MKSYQQSPVSELKKTGMKREGSPFGIPYKRKARGKETSPGYFSNPLSPRGRARARYAEAGAAADELIEILGARPTERNRRLWAYYCYHHSIEAILDKAHEVASRHRQGELGNPVSAFQRWLQENYGRGAR